jgi:hypothetical protein
MELPRTLLSIFRNKKRLALAGAFVIVIAGLWSASGRQRRSVEEGVTIKNQEILQVFYSELNGSPHRYKIYADAPFRLYAGVLSPNTTEGERDFSILINYQSSPQDEPAVPIAMLDGKTFEWSSYFDLFDGEQYLKGPSLGTGAPEEIKGTEKNPGIYEIVVFSPDNYGKYVLLTGDKRSFSPKALGETLLAVPQLKKSFFGRPIFTAIFSLDGILLLILAGAALGAGVFGLYKLVRRLKPARRTQEEQYLKEPEEES